MELYEKSAVMTRADRERLGEMIAVVKRRQLRHAASNSEMANRERAAPAPVAPVWLPSPASSLLAIDAIDAGEASGASDGPTRTTDRAANPLPIAADDQAGADDGEEAGDVVEMPRQRYSARRLMDRLEATR
jgi:hypothetical protein